MFRKRNKPYTRSDHNPSKRRRPLPPHPPSPQPQLDSPTYRQPPPEAVVVTGLAPDASVLDLKARFEVYGPISRIRIDRDGVGYITYRLQEAAESAVAASLDPSFAITIESRPLQVMWATDPLCKWREGIVMERDRNTGGASSKLVRGEAPLSKYGRGNKLGSAVVVNSRVDDGKSSSVFSRVGKSSSVFSRVGDENRSLVMDQPFKGRGIVAYDDIL